MHAIQQFTFPDTGSNLTIVEYDGQPVVTPDDVANLIGHHSAKKVAALARKHGRPRDHFITITGNEASTFASAVLPAGTATHQVRSYTLLTERGLYKVLLHAETALCRRVQDWITDEVLPSIRRTGGYGTVTVDPGLMARVEQTEAGLATIGAAVARLADAVHVLATRQTPAQQGNLPERMVLPPPEGWLRAGQIASDNKIKILRVNAVIKALRKEYGRIGCVGPRTGWHAGETYFYSPIEIERIEAGLLARGWIEDPKNNIINMFRVK